MKDPRVGFVTVTAVNTSPDLRHARVFVSVLGDEDARSGCIDGAARPRTASCSARSGSSLRMKHTPTLTFLIDETALRRRAARGADRGERPRRRPAEPDGAGRMSTTEAVVQEAREQVLDALRGGERFVLITHEHPDGDALGSLVGMHGLLTALGKDSVMFVGADEFPLPYEYRWFDLEGVRSKVPSDLEERTIIFLDCGNIDRNPVEAFRRPGGLTLNIDHHHDNTRFGGVNLVVPDASCTAEIVWDLGRALGVAAHGADRRGAVRRPRHRHRPVHVREHRPARARDGGGPDRGRHRPHGDLPARVRGLARAQAAAARAGAVARRALRRRRADDDAAQRARTSRRPAPRRATPRASWTTCAPSRGRRSRRSRASSSTATAAEGVAALQRRRRRRVRSSPAPPAAAGTRPPRASRPTWPATSSSSFLSDQVAAQL